MREPLYMWHYHLHNEGDEEQALKRYYADWVDEDPVLSQALVNLKLARLAITARIEQLKGEGNE